MPTLGDDAGAWTPPDSWVNVYDENASWARIVVDDLPIIDAAVSRYIASKVDSIIRVRFIEGETYCVLASAIRSWYKNTAEFRERERQVTKKLETEEANANHPVGIR